MLKVKKSPVTIKQIGGFSLDVNLQSLAKNSFLTDRAILTGVLSGNKKDRQEGLSQLK